MAVDCSTYVDAISCALSVNALAQTKLMTLLIILAYSIAIFYFHGRIQKEKSYMHFWSYYLAKVLSLGYLIFSPLFFTLLLNPEISLEVFITIIVTFYIVLTGLFIGMSIYGGTSQIFRMFGFDDWNELKDELKDRRSMKKYG